LCRWEVDGIRRADDVEIAVGIKGEAAGGIISTASQEGGKQLGGGRWVNLNQEHIRIVRIRFDCVIRLEQTATCRGQHIGVASEIKHDGLWARIVVGTKESRVQQCRSGGIKLSHECIAASKSKHARITDGSGSNGESTVTVSGTGDIGRARAIDRDCLDINRIPARSVKICGIGKSPDVGEFTHKSDARVLLRGITGLEGPGRDGKVVGVGSAGNVGVPARVDRYCVNCVVWCRPAGGAAILDDAKIAGEIGGIDQRRSIRAERR